MNPFSRTLAAAFLDLLTRLLASTSLRWNQRIGRFLGWLAWVSNSKLRQVALINLELCFPSLPDQERETLARKSLIHTGMAFTEAPWIGLRPKNKTLALIKQDKGESPFHLHQKAGKGMLVATPHLGSWELTCLVMSEMTPLTYMYRSPRNALMEPHLLKWRAHLGGTPAKLDASGIRQALKQVRQGNVVGILPDQEPDLGAGTFAPFLGVPAYTMTLMAKLAARTGAPVLFCIVERLPNGKGWKVIYEPAETGIDSQDQVIAATALNITVARCIEHCAEQYSWSYKRFRQLESGGRRQYRR